MREFIAAEWPACEIKVVATRFAFTGEIQLRRYDLILADYTVGSFNGMDALQIVKDRAPDTPFIFVSGTIGEDRAIEAVRLGAQDYVLKDRMKRLITALPRAIRDSEERRKREAAERRVHELAEMINQAREALVIVDLEDTIISWNAGAEQLFGWRSEEVLGKTIAQLFNRQATTQLEVAREETFAKGSWSGELQLHNRQMTSIIVDSRQTLVRDDSGKPKALLSFNSDITDRKRLQEQFLRAQRMENIGLLAAGIAHDLNNVLAPMVMSAPMLRQWVKEKPGLQMIELLEKSAQRGSGLVRQILTFAQGASSEHRLVQVKVVMRDIASVITGTFPKTIRLEEDVPDDLWPIRASAIQIHQVLLNLCVNARDAMSEGGGMLRLRAENCLLDVPAARGIEGGFSGTFVVLHVEDTGPGIAPEVLGPMWEPFYTTKGSDKGTGLGLSTVRGIVKSHGGFVEVRTRLGQGTVFRAYLPTAEGVAAKPARPGAEVVTGGELILVVEDSADIREMTAAMLTRQGYRVLMASDGAEAMNLFTQRGAEIRVVITDIRMPNLDGAALAHMLYRINPHVRMLVVSGVVPGATPSTNPWPDDFAADFLAKPFKPDMLLKKVRDLINAPAAPITRTFPPVPPINAV